MRISFWLVVIYCLFLVSCATVPPPDNPHNICHIFRQYPEWRKSAEQVEQRWRVPIGVQMAIIYQESSFICDAKPPRTKLLGFIPWTRPTSAYGYCQAIDDTWDLFQKSNECYWTQRDEFADANEFVGWYAGRAQRRAGISPSDAYSLYLAYHEGITNYMNKTYLKKPWLMRVAKKVRARAAMYCAQLKKCCF